MGTGRHARGRVDYVLLLHLERRQMDRQGKASSPTKSCSSLLDICVIYMIYNIGRLFHGALPVRSTGGAARARLDASRRFHRFEVLRYAESLETRRSWGKTVDTLISRLVILDIDMTIIGTTIVCIGMDRRSDTDILYLRSRSRRFGSPRQLQQI